MWRRRHQQRARERRDDPCRAHHPGALDRGTGARHRDVDRDQRQHGAEHEAVERRDAYLFPQQHAGIRRRDLAECEAALPLVDADPDVRAVVLTGTGDTDNASFQITGSTLKTNAVFNFETKSSYSIRVRSTDSVMARTARRNTSRYRSRLVPTW